MHPAVEESTHVEGRAGADEMATVMMTEVVGADNAKAKRPLGGVANLVLCSARLACNDGLGPV